MLVRQSFDDRFVTKLKELENKYGLEMFELDGIGPDKLDWLGLGVVDQFCAIASLVSICPLQRVNQQVHCFLTPPLDCLTSGGR